MLALMQAPQQVMPSSPADWRFGVGPGSGQPVGLDGSSCCQVQPRQDLFVEGDRAGYVYEVLEGTVCGYRILPDGARHVVSFYFEGDLLGYSSGIHYAMSAQAVTPVRVRRTPRATVERLLELRPELARKFLRMTAEELSATRDHLLCIAAKSAEAKIASFILALSRRNAMIGLDSDEVHLPMTRLDIGDYLGLTVETVSRTLTKFKTAGLIALPRATRVLLLDPEALAAMANG